MGQVLPPHRGEGSTAQITTVRVVIVPQADLETPKLLDSTVRKDRVYSWDHPKPLGMLQHSGRQESASRWLRLEETPGFI